MQTQRKLKCSHPISINKYCFLHIQAKLFIFPSTFEEYKQDSKAKHNSVESMLSAVHICLYTHCVSMRKIVGRGNATEGLVCGWSHAEEYVCVNTYYANRI
jgi:hypothetical protein